MARGRTRGKLALLLALLTGLVASLLTPASPAAAYAGAPWFRPGFRYDQNFPDPSVIRVGNTYYAYATATGGSYLPVMSSTDLVNWTARPAYNPGPPLNSDPFFNDALPYPASWAVDRPVGGRLTKEVWAPGVARIGGRYVAFYTARIHLDRDRFCISVATADSPLGPFVDTTPGPIVCDGDPNGSIDPQPFVDDDGTPYLLWKSEGFPGFAPTRIWAAAAEPRRHFVRAPASAQRAAAAHVPAVGGPRHREPGRWCASRASSTSSTPATSTARPTTPSAWPPVASPLGPCTKSASNPVIASATGRSSARADRRRSSTPAAPCGSRTTGGTRRTRAIPPTPPRERAPARPRGSGAMSVVAFDPRVFGPAVGLAANKNGNGYWIARQGGGVVARGAAAAPQGASSLSGPAVGIAAAPSGSGWWVASATGDVDAGGDAPDHGNVAHVPLAQPVVGISARPGGGYWSVARDGGVFTFGDASFCGSTGAIQLNQPVVGMAPTTSGNGYWLVASDGGIFSFGDAGVLAPPARSA